MSTTENSNGKNHASLMEKADHILDPMNVIGNALQAASNTDYTRETKVTSDTTEHVQGHNTHVDQTTDTHVELSGDFDNRVMELVNGKIVEWSKEREERENRRANKRNLNRMLTLIGALVIGVAVVFTLPMLGHVGQVLAPFAFTITILLDTGLALYGYVKKY